MNRRDFVKCSLKWGGGVAATPVLSRMLASSAYAQTLGSAKYRALVCVYLYGGNDGNNTLIPLDSRYTQYAAPRQQIALGQSSLLPLNASGSSRLYGLHPSLQNVAALYNQGNAAWLANAGPLVKPFVKGDDGNLFGHDTQAYLWQSSVVGSPCTTGWGGRVADLVTSRSAATSPVAISTSGWQILGAGMTSSQASAGTGTNSINALNALQAMTPYLAAIEGNHDSNELVNAISGVRKSFLGSTSLVLNSVNKGATLKTQFPNTPLGQQLQIVAQMINARSMFDTNTQIFMTSDGEYDTHGTQRAIQDNKLSQLDGALGAFASAMQEIGMFDDVTLFTMTDFARSMVANTSGGTDHAWGNHHLIVGGGVKGGQIYGTFPDLTLGGPDDFNQSGLWIPTTSATQYAATLTKWLGIGASDLNSIFPELANFPAGTLGFMG